MKSICFIAAFLMFGVMFGQSQISGLITDGENGSEPLALASISVIETNQTIKTDLDGKYKLPLTEGEYTLKISFIGYEPILIEQVKVAKAADVKINRSLKARKPKVITDLAFN